MNKFNVVVITECGIRALLSMRNKTAFCKRVAVREAKEYALKHNRTARVVPDDQPMHELDDFVRGYLDAALWSTNDDDGNAGFWDRGFGYVGNKLSEAAKVYGSVDLFVTESGKVYQA
jgi:hypothetical protein